VQNIFEVYAVYHIIFYINHKTKNLWRSKMKAKDYWGLALFAVLTIAAFIVGITNNNKIVIIAGYIFIVMSQVAYLIAYTKTIKREVDNIKKILIKK